jgi:hypothetical protein
MSAPQPYFQYKCALLKLKLTFLQQLCTSIIFLYTVFKWTLMDRKQLLLALQ